MLFLFSFFSFNFVACDECSASHEMNSDNKTHKPLVICYDSLYGKKSV